MEAFYKRQVLKKERKVQNDIFCKICYMKIICEIECLLLRPDNMHHVKPTRYRTSKNKLKVLKNKGKKIYKEIRLRRQRQIEVRHQRLRTLRKRKGHKIWKPLIDHKKMKIELISSGSSVSSESDLKVHSPNTSSSDESSETFSCNETKKMAKLYDQTFQLSDTVSDSERGLRLYLNKHKVSKFEKFCYAFSQTDDSSMSDLDNIDIDSSDANDFKESDELSETDMSFINRPLAFLKHPDNIELVRKKYKFLCKNKRTRAHSNQYFLKRYIDCFGRSPFFCY